MTENEEFERELKQGFLEEASLLVADAERCFLELETSPGDPSLLEQIFRIAHNLKGSSKAVGFSALGAFTHEFESFLLKCKSGEHPVTPKIVSLFLKCNDHIRKSLDALKQDLSADLDSSAILAEILAFDGTSSDPALSVDADIMADLTTAMTEMDLGAQLAPVPTEVAISPAHPQPTKAPTPVNKSSDESIRVSLARLDKLLNFVGEMVILQTVLREQVASIGTPLLRTTIHQMGKVTKEVQELSMGLRMVPLKQTFLKMQRVVRDTAAQLEKKVDLQLEGEDTEVDKTILESLADPLVHLVRNAVDHGIESPADRIANGKTETGRITLRALHQGGKLVIEVNDDGGGISADRLRQKGAEKGILKPGQVLSDKEAIELIFHPGFSTKAVVTDVSGRGVGMDVVKTNIEQIQGEVLIETVLGQGSRFKVVLPLTLAIIDGMVVRCGDDRFVIPLSHVQESVKPQANDLHRSTNLGEVLELRGFNLPVMRLAQALGRKRTKGEDEARIAVIIQSQGRPFAVLVDDIIGQHQVVIKKLGSELTHAKGFCGSAVLGDGKPALILELGDLVSSFKSKESA